VPIQTVTAARAAADACSEHDPQVIGASVRARAPLRLGLAGGGTDVSPYCDLYGGIVLNATVDRYCYATVEERLDGRVVFKAVDLGVETDLDDGSDLLTLHRAVHRRLVQDYGLGRPSLTLTTLSEAPPGSGLGSSSTLIVSIVEAYREYFSLPLGEYDVARVAFQVERRDCGLKGGRQDQYAATFGGFNIMEFGADERAIISPLRLKAAIIREFEASLVLYHTGVSRASADIIERQTAHIQQEIPEQLEATHALRREAVAMKEALLVGNFHRMAEILDSGWQSKKQLALGITSTAIDLAFEAALSAGALAGKVSGAGGGGYVMFLVEPMRRPGVEEALAAQPVGDVAPVHFVSEGAVAWTLR
jgi:D-glycero-alpha-D-manno-heptose-7-phosphate kinase